MPESGTRQYPQAEFWDYLLCARCQRSTDEGSFLEAYGDRFYCTACVAILQWTDGAPHTHEEEGCRPLRPS